MPVMGVFVAMASGCTWQQPVCVTQRWRVWVWHGRGAGAGRLDVWWTDNAATAGSPMLAMAASFAEYALQPLSLHKRQNCMYMWRNTER